MDAFNYIYSDSFIHGNCHRFVSHFINLFRRAHTKKEYRDIYIGQF